MSCEVRLTGGGFNFSRVALREPAEEVARALNSAHKARILLVKFDPAQGNVPVYVNPLHVMAVLPHAGGN